MPAYVTQNEAAIRLRHYVTNATDRRGPFFNFYSGQLGRYREKYGDDFCLIVNCSTTEDDAYILPFSVFGDFFTDEYLDGQRRWLAHVRADRLVMNRTGRPPKESRSVHEFHNAFGLLTMAAPAMDESLIARRVADAAEAELSRAQGRFVGDVADRLAIEKYAVSKATAHFEEQGFVVEDVGSTRAYDLSCTKDGREMRVEVKGTTSSGEQVILTRNETTLEHSLAARGLAGVLRELNTLVSGVPVLRRRPCGPSACFATLSPEP